MLPSATEIVCAIGLRDRLVGVTHECDFPAGVEKLPHLTASKIIRASMSSSEIDHAVRASLNGHGSIYELDELLLGKLDPDLVITQELCEVCAVSYEEVRNAARSYTAGATVVSLEPRTVGDVMENILEVGRLAGSEPAAKALVDSLGDRLASLRAQTALIEKKPSVIMLEWLDPPFAPGHWVPEQVDAAGGTCVLGEPGEKSLTTDFDSVRATNAEVLILIPCGYDTAGTLAQLELTSLPGFLKNLPAIANGNVWALDASAYFSRPGPRLIDGAEILAKILHPGVFGSPKPEEAVRVKYPLLKFNQDK